MMAAMAHVAWDRSRGGHGDPSLARPSGWVLGFALAVCGWQGVLFIALFSGAMPLNAFAEVHILGCFVLAAWLLLRRRRSLGDERNSAGLQVVAWSAFGGLFGAFVATALAFAPQEARSEISPGQDTTDLMTDDLAIERDKQVHVALLDRRIRLEGASSIRPLIDIVAEGSGSEKLEALRVVYRRYDAGLSTVLKRALQDPDTSVRVLAATVIAKLHATYSNTIGDRQAAAAANPGAATSWRSLADARLAYAESGLLEPPRAQAQIELAAGDLSRAAELDSDWKLI